MYIMSNHHEEGHYQIPQKTCYKDSSQESASETSVADKYSQYHKSFTDEFYPSSSFQPDLKYSSDKKISLQDPLSSIGCFEYSQEVPGPSGLSEFSEVSSPQISFPKSDAGIEAGDLSSIKSSSPIISSYETLFGGPAETYDIEQVHSQADTQSYEPVHGQNHGQSNTQTYIHSHGHPQSRIQTLMHSHCQSHSPSDSFAITSESFDFISTDFNPDFNSSTNIPEIASTNSSLLPNVPTMFMSSLKQEDEGGDSSSNTSTTSETRMSITTTSAGIAVPLSSSTETQGTSIDPLATDEANLCSLSGGVPQYKPTVRTRRGRRRGYRRGRYASYMSNKVFSSNVRDRDDLDAFEDRNILEESKQAYVQITEQPRPKALRFRYICEGRSAGSIPGVESSPTRKTFPSIRVVSSKGPALAVVSCVTVSPPYRPHPHNLVGKDGCDEGVCSAIIDNQVMECSFSNLGIQCVKKKDIEASLTKREEKGIDPFKTGFEHRNHPQSIDLNSIRLCFQVYLIDPRTGDRFPLKPVVSDPIYDKKTTTDLVIYKLSACSSCVVGGKEMILLCDKIAKEDIQIRFFEMQDGRFTWEAFGEFQAADVHKQVAISFKTPPYMDLEIKQAIKVWLQLFRPSDKSASEPIPFEFYPLIKDYEYFEDKILHITPYTKMTTTPLESPGESMQEASDDGDNSESSVPGVRTKGTRHSRTSPIHCTKTPRKSSKVQQEPYPTNRQTRSMLIRVKDQPSTPYPTASDQPLPFDQSYCPQLEHLRGAPYFEQEGSPRVELAAVGYQSPINPSNAIGSAEQPLGPTATLATASTGGGIVPYETEIESTGLLYHNMDCSPSSPSNRTMRGSSDRRPKDQPPSNCPSLPSCTHPSGSSRDDERERSLSPNSETLKRLKHDIETLNKLANL